MANIITIAQTVWLEMIRRKDLYIVLILQGFFTLLLTSVDAFGSDVPSSYIMDIGLLLAFLLSIALAMTMGARQFPSEERSGTIFTILTKPIGRLEFLLGKWCGIWSSLVAANALFYLIITAVTLSRGYAFSPPVLFQVFCLHSCMLGIIAAMALFFTLFLTQAAGGTLTGICVALIYLFLPRIPNMLAYESGWRQYALGLLYFLAPHLELFDMRARVLHGWGLLRLDLFLGTLAYGALLTAGFLALAWCIFRKKHFKRGASL
jgi:ABC-type transport system involved in multi-copper enzyme maturation permease subunit